MAPVRRGLFRYSRWDVLSIAVIPFHAICFITLAYYYSSLSAWAMLALLPVHFAISLQNSGANHNHYHTPIFRPRWLNQLARLGFSMTGFPRTPTNIGHGIHHATTASWNDASILDMMGLRRPLHKQVLAFAMYFLESFGFKYVVFLVLLKSWPVERVAAYAARPEEVEMATRLFRRVKEPDAMRATLLDIAVWLAFRAVLCYIDWQFFVFYFIPATYVIDTLRRGENFMQHWGATDPADPSRDSVSCYGKIYNALTFNLGYHQEHHQRAGTHWLKLPAARAALPSDRRIVPVSHYINMPVFFPAFARQLAERNAVKRAREDEQARENAA